MEVQFGHTPHRCMRQMVWDQKNMEETLELRTADSGSGVVLGAWGQPVIRSKYWDRTEAGVSGGVMVWVLYQTEEGEVQCAEGWIPFRRSWELRDSVRDGTVCAQVCLRSVDARMTGLGKLMVRACLSLWAEAVEPGEVSVFAPRELPEDIRLLKNTYPVTLPMEAGEKAMTVEEELVLTPGLTEARRLLCASLQPRIAEQKLMADKLVFRGGTEVSILYEDAEGRVRRFEADVPISQYIQLEGEYGPEATFRIVPVVSDLDTELMEDGRIRLKAGIIGQYQIYDRVYLETVEDAYSNHRQVAVKTQQLDVPMVLDSTRRELEAECRLPVQAKDVVDCRVLLAQPKVEREGVQQMATVEGAVQLLYYDPDDQLQCQLVDWQAPMQQETAESCRMMAAVWDAPGAEYSVQADQVTVSAHVAVNTACTGCEGMECVLGLSYTEREPADPKRPSLILRRSGGKTLWQLAKACGSTVEAIWDANGLTEEPDGDRMLLIPVC